MTQMLLVPDHTLRNTTVTDTVLSVMNGVRRPGGWSRLLRVQHPGKVKGRPP